MICVDAIDESKFLRSVKIPTIGEISSCENIDFYSIGQSERFTQDIHVIHILQQ